MEVFGAAIGAAKAVNTGLNIGTGRGLHGAGGFGAMAGAGAIGAGLGASATVMSDGTVNPVVGAAVGGAIGTVALPAAGLAAGAFGNAAVGAVKAAPAVGKAVGAGALKAAPFVGAVGAKMATDVGSSIWGVGKKLINWDEGAEFLNHVKFTGPISGIKQGWEAGETAAQKVIGGATGAVINGKNLLALSALTEGTKKAWGSIESAKMGTMTGVATPSPRTPSYANNAGATGDLVFALNANKRG